MDPIVPHWCLVCCLGWGGSLDAFLETKHFSFCTHCEHHRGSGIGLCGAWCPALGREGQGPLCVSPGSGLPWLGPCSRRPTWRSGPSGQPRRTVTCTDGPAGGAQAGGGGAACPGRCVGHGAEWTCVTSQEVRPAELRGWKEAGLQPALRPGSWEKQALAQAGAVGQAGLWASWGRAPVRPDLGGECIDAVYSNPAV